MKIHLEQNEIHDALRQYIDNRGFDLEGFHIEVQLTAGRGENGHYADLTINKEAAECIPNDASAENAFDSLDTLEDEDDDQTDLFTKD